MKTVSLTILLLLACLYTHSASAKFRHVHRRFPTRCCASVTSQNISKYITEKTYRNQSAKNSCVEAIILKVNQKEVCVDPAAKWVQKVIVNMTYEGSVAV